MPQYFKDASVISLFKNKDCKSDCGNCKDISVLLIAREIRARVILNRVTSSVSEESLPDAECGFRPGHSTVDIGFLDRHVQEKCTEQLMGLYFIFIDLAKAFDTVNGGGGGGGGGGHSGSYSLSVAIPVSSPISFVFSMTA